MLKKCIPLLLCLLLCLCMHASAAGTVTDTLTVKVGYWGMDVDSYVEVGTFHWSELEQNLPLHRQAYSFFRPDAEGEYRTAIDSAYGFYLSDLLSYADIDRDSVLSLQFYTQDQAVGFFTSFTDQDLFGTRRYYFDDLAAHIRPVYADDGSVEAWDAAEAWEHSTQVPAMLALEDSWVWYDIGTEHTAPSYETMGTGNRFRLLFGQASPTETRTNQTAKYTHTVFVTLAGSPELGELPEIDTTIGAHSLTVTVTVANRTLLDAAASLLQVRSSDEDVLRITDIQTTPDARYSDLIQAEIFYEILSEGEASLSFAMGTQTIGSFAPIVIPNCEPEESKPTEPPQEDPEEPPPEEDGGQNTTAEEPTEPESGGQTAEQPKPTSEPAAAQPASEPTQPAQEPALQDETELPPGRQPEIISEPPAAKRQAILLDAATAAKLARKSVPEAAGPKQTVKLRLPEQESANTLLWTALAAVLLLLLGGSSAWIHFRKER